MFSNAEFELADRRSEEERVEGLRQVRASLEGEGAADCIDCDEPIPAARRKAVPNARRCAGCQSDHESRA